MYFFVEVFVGFGMLVGFFVLLVLFVFIFIGVIGVVLVIKVVYIDKCEFKCVCVGGNLDFFFGFILFIENFVMLGVGFYMFIWWIV